MTRSPRVVIIAGINGAGKTTAARRLLVEFGIDTYLDADAIARELTGGYDETIRAGRIMHERIQRLRSDGADFAFETTLAGLSLRAKLDRLHDSGYQSYLLYLWLPSELMAIQRVAGRVRMGGHPVPDADVRRRYLRSVWNFQHVYRPAVSRWRVYHGASGFGFADDTLIAEGKEGREVVHDWRAWSELQAQVKQGESL